jgi:hypothetical protein
LSLSGQMMLHGGSSPDQSSMESSEKILPLVTGILSPRKKKAPAIPPRHNPENSAENSFHPVSVFHGVTSLSEDQNTRIEPEARIFLEEISKDFSVLQQ